MLEAIVKVLDKIKSTSSSKSKESILKENMHLKGLNLILFFLYNPYIVTGIKSKKLVKFAHFTSDKAIKFNNVIEAIDYIVDNNTGRDEDVKAIANFINQHNGREHDFLQDLFTKDYKCGITAKTVNKVFKGLIPTFDVMLAKKYVEEEHKIKGNFFITLKLDGIRAICIKKNGEINFYTRQGQPITGLTELEENYSHLPDNTVYDGELLLNTIVKMPSKDLFRATGKVVKKDGVKGNLNHILYDIISVEEFENGVSFKVYKERRKQLDDLKTVGFIKVLPVLYYGNDKSKVWELLDEVVADDKEGLMINVERSYYITKRTNQLLKLKKFHSFEDIVIDVYEGEGKNKGKLGGVVIKFKDITTRVGSGFSDHERESYWNDPEEVIGKIAECAYFEESENQNGGKDLRFCTWKGVRFDKSIDDINYD